MDAIHRIERQWFRAAAVRLVATKGVEHAREVADFHRREPMPGASFYPDMIEDAIKASEVAA